MLLHKAIGDSLTLFVIHFSLQASVKSTADTLGTDTLNLHCAALAEPRPAVNCVSDVM